MHLIYWCLEGNPPPLVVSNQVKQSAQLPVGYVNILFQLTKKETKATRFDVFRAAIIYSSSPSFNSFHSWWSSKKPEFRKCISSLYYNECRFKYTRCMSALLQPLFLGISRYTNSLSLLKAYLRASWVFKTSWSSEKCWRSIYLHRKISKQEKRNRSLPSIQNCNNSFNGDTAMRFTTGICLWFNI